MTSQNSPPYLDANKLGERFTDVLKVSEKFSSNFSEVFLTISSSYSSLIFYFIFVSAQVLAEATTTIALAVSFYFLHKTLPNAIQFSAL